MNKIIKTAIAVTIAATSIGGTAQALGDDTDTTIDASAEASNMEEFVATDPDMQDLCYTVPGLAYDIYLSPAFLAGEQDVATDMVVSWLVEEFEKGVGYNLGEEAEVVLVDYLQECAL